MSNWVNAQFTIDDAIARRESVWELLVKNWGATGMAGGDGYSASFPQVGERGLPTVAGIAIGPRSTVDRCFVANSLQKVIPAGVTWDYAQRLSVGTPILYPQVGLREVVQASAPPLTPDVGRASLVIYPVGAVSTFGPPTGEDSTLIPSGTYTAADGTAQTMAPGLGLNKVFVGPVLDLLFFLGSGVVYAPPARVQASFSQVLAATGGDELLFSVPVFGRKKVFITARCTAASTFVVGALQTIQGKTQPGEVLLYTGASVAANVSTQIVIDPCGADYLLLYNKAPFVVGLRSMVATITAED